MLAIELEKDPEPRFLTQFTALSEFHDIDVNAICRKLNVEPISSFLDRYKFDAGDDEDTCTWYSAENGAKTFSALAQQLPQHLDERQNLDPTQLRCELEDACVMLTDAARENLRFHLVVVIIPPGMEHLIGG